MVSFVNDQGQDLSILNFSAFDQNSKIYIVKEIKQGYNIPLKLINHDINNMG